MKTWIRGAAAKYTLYGAIFGAFFPLIAFLIMTFIGRNIDLLFYIICTAPFFLGLFARFAGIRQDRLNEINRNLEALVAERTNAIQNLLDVSGQGFLYFGADLIVRPEHSRECENIFSGSIEGKRITDLLFINEEKRTDFADGLKLFIEGKAKAAVIFELLDSEVRIGEKVIEIEYRAMDDSSVMCTLTDITERLDLEAEIAEQNKRRNIILRTVSNRKYFPSFVNEALELFDFYDSMDDSDTDDLDEIMRRLHTFKSNASFLGFDQSQNHAHELEGMIADALVLEDRIDLHERIATLKSNYYGELTVISETLGEEWIRSLESTSIPSKHFRKIESYIRKRYSRDSQLIRTLERYRRIRLAEVFLRYPELARELAQSRGKRLNPVTIAGGGELVLPEHFEGIANACVHLIRNMVDHGIESPREREVKGKNPDGSINITIQSTSSEHLITFADDGSGLQLAKIAKKGRDLGLIDDDEPLSRRKLISVIFNSGFSTSDTVTTMSGRGVGLSAVKSAVSAAGGRIMVDSRPDEGTTFRIAIPKAVNGELKRNYQ